MIKEFHHVGVSVENLQKSVKFYIEALGMEIDYTAYHKGQKISKVVGVEDAELDICMLRRGDARLELIDYKNKEKGSTGYKEQYSPGLIHISFVVSDIEQEYSKIRAMGYEFNSPPMVTRENGPKICYFKGPDNVIIELYEKV